jgi:hypothetical protein
MSLNWDLMKIDNHETVCWEHITDPTRCASIKQNGTGGWFAPAWFEEDDGTVKVMRPKTNALIWMMMNLGCKGVITDKNVDLVVEQVAIWQRVGGAFMGERVNNQMFDVYITEQDVRDHIGLRTNCFSNTPRQFKERVWKLLKEEAMKWLDGEVESVRKAKQSALEALAEVAIDEGAA